MGSCSFHLLQVHTCPELSCSIVSNLESQLQKSCPSFGEAFLGRGVETMYFPMWIPTDSSGRLGKTDSD